VMIQPPVGGTFILVGADFGCIHWEASASDGPECHQCEGCRYWDDWRGEQMAYEGYCRRPINPGIAVNAGFVCEQWEGRE